MLASVEKAVVLVYRKFGVQLGGGGVVLRPSSSSASSAYIFYQCPCRLYSSRYSHDNYTNNRSGNNWNRSSVSSSNDGEEAGVRGSRSRRGRTGWIRTKDLASSIKVNNARPRKSEDERFSERMKMTMDEYKKEFRKEIREYGDPIDEPSPHVFSKKLDDYVEETARMKDMIKAQRQTKKHYARLIPKEVSLLTWAEKENIRYLHESDPEQWTPEAISNAYPVTPEGASKLIRSSMRLRTLKDVKMHDDKVALKINMIKSGEIPVTEELENKLKIRELIPLKVGDLGMYPDQYVDTSLPSQLGEFARLVAPPSVACKKDSQDDKKVPVVQCLSDGDFYDPSITSGPNYNDSQLKPELSKEELKKILPASKRMTFSEFEHRMQKKGAGKKAGDMKYMLEELSNTNSISPSSTPEEIELPFGKGYDPQFPSNIQKYRKPDETGQVVVQVEGEQAYLYESDTGYQKPYGAPSSSRGGNPNPADAPERIVIPEKYRGRAGATYKVGSCYYDEDGEFLYKVI